MVYCIFAGLAATRLKALDAYVSDVTSALTCGAASAGQDDPHVVESQRVQLLIADNLGAIIICLLHVALCLLVIVGRCCGGTAPGSTFMFLMVTTWYSWIILISLAGTLQVCSASMAQYGSAAMQSVYKSKMDLGGLAAAPWDEESQGYYDVAWGVLYAVCVGHLLYALMLFRVRRMFLNEVEAVEAANGPKAPGAPGAAPDTPPEVEPAPTRGGLFGFGRKAAEAPAPPPPASRPNPLYSEPSGDTYGGGGHNTYGGGGRSSDNPWGGAGGGGGGGAWGDGGNTRANGLYEVSHV